MTMVKMASGKPRRVSWFLTSYDNVLFILGLIIFLAVLTHWVGAESGENPSSGTSKSGSIKEQMNHAVAFLEEDETTEEAMTYDEDTEAPPEEVTSTIAPDPPDPEMSSPGITIGPGEEANSAGITTAPEEEMTSAAVTDELKQEMTSEGITGGPEEMMSMTSTSDPSAEVTDGPKTDPEVPTRGDGDYNKVVKIALIFENPDSVPWVDAAIKYLNANAGPDMKFEVVNRFLASQTVDAVGLITKLCKLIDSLQNDQDVKPDLILDLTVTGIASESVKIITKTLKLPTVSASVGLHGDVREWSLLSVEEEKYLIRIQPPLDILDQAFRSLTEMQNISKAVIYFDPRIEINHKSKSVLRDAPVFHTVIHIPHEKPLRERFRRQLKKWQEVGYEHIFIVGRSEVISAALEEAENWNFVWYALSTDGKTISCPSCQKDWMFLLLTPTYTPKSGDNFLNLQNLDPRNIQGGFFYYLTIDSARAVAIQKERKFWRRSDIGKIPCVNFDLRARYPNIDIDLLSTLEQWQRQNDLQGSYVFGVPSEVGQPGTLNHALIHLEIQQVEMSSSQMNRTTIGNWTAGLTGANLIQLERDGAKDLGVYGHYSPRILRVVTCINPPLVYWKKDCTKVQDPEKGEWDHCYSGYSIDVLDTLKKQLNFNYTIRHIVNFGDMDRRSEWNGTMGELLHQRADIALGAMTIMPERLRVVDFTIPYHPLVGFTFVMQKSKLPAAHFKFMMVLEKDVWMCIIGAYVFTTLLLFIFDKYSPASKQNENEEYIENEVEEESTRVFTIKECMWFCFTSMTPQGGGEAPKGLSGRLVASTWWLFSFIIIASYTANMAAFLTVARLAKPIISFDDLINQHRVQFAPVMASSAYFYFDRMANVEQIFYEKWRDLSLNDSLTDWDRSRLAVWTYPVSDKYTKLWQAMISNQPPETYAEGVEKTLYVDPEHPNLIFALVGEETDLKYLTMIHCQLKIVGKPFSRRAYGIAVQKGSPLKDELNEGLAKMRYRRELEYFHRKWWAKNPENRHCSRELTIDDGIGFGNLGGIWAVSAGGVVLAFVTSFLEIIYFKLSSRIQTFTTKVREMNTNNRVLSWMKSKRQETNFETDFKTDYSSNLQNMTDTTSGKGSEIPCVD